MGTKPDGRFHRFRFAGSADKFTIEESRTFEAMDILFAPFSIRNLTLSNRIVMPALAGFLTGKEGTITEDMLVHYRMRASGGPAMVIAEAAAVSKEGVVSPNQARIDRDRCIDGLSRLAAAIEAEGVAPAIQLHHAGRQTSSKVIGRLPVAPSPLPCPTIRGEVHPLCVREIEALVARFGDAAVRAREAGFRLIEIHGAHGYLVGQFLSPFSNRRTDDYGGSTRNRARFAVEIVREIRRRIGPDVPLSFKISAREYVKNGLDVEESIRLLARIVEAGVDVVQVSAGTDATPEWICQPAFMETACLAGAAGRVRAALPVPVMAVGRLNHPQTARAVIADGKADLVCIGRGLLADPDLPRKAAEGRENDIRVCIACNSCMASIFKNGRVECLVNPSLGREKEMAVRPAKRRKRLVVAGGGPAGMNAAWVAARRGHRVVLFERGTCLGGQLKAAADAIPHKRDIHHLVDFHRRQVERYGVDCRLGCPATVDSIRNEAPDAVLLATGARPLVPPVPGADASNTATFRQVLNGCKPDRAPTVVVGGGATGCDVALFLAGAGIAVTLIEALPRLAGDLEAMTRKMLLRMLKKRGVRLLTETRLMGIGGGAIQASQNGGKPVALPAENVVFAVGSRPDTRLWDALENEPFEVHRIGDCRTPKSAKEAILQAARIARRI